MKLVTATRSAIVFNLLICLFLIFRLNDYNTNSLEITSNSSKLAQLESIASEVRQSSEWLTMFVRAYAVTNEPRFKKYFEFVLAVRSGSEPIPDQYTTNFWPEILAGQREFPIADGRTGHSVVARLESIGASPQQLRKIKNAVIFSDELATLENLFFNIAGTGHAFDTSHSSADIKLLFNQAYFAKKSRIMAPLDEVLTSLDKELRQVIKRTESNNQELYAELVSVLILWIVVSAVLIMHIHARHVRICRHLINSSILVLSGGDRHLDVSGFEPVIKESYQRMLRSIEFSDLSVSVKNSKLVSETLNTVTTTLAGGCSGGVGLSERLFDLQEQLKLSLNKIVECDVHLIGLPYNTQRIMDAYQPEYQVSNAKSVLHYDYLTITFEAPLGSQKSLAKIKMVARTYSALVHWLLNQHTG